MSLWLQVFLHVQQFTLLPGHRSWGAPHLYYPFSSNKEWHRALLSHINDRAVGTHWPDTSILLGKVLGQSENTSWIKMEGPPLQQNTKLEVTADMQRTWCGPCTLLRSLLFRGPCSPGVLLSFWLLLPPLPWALRVEIDGDIQRSLLLRVMPDYICFICCRRRLPCDGWMGTVLWGEQNVIRNCFITTFDFSFSRPVVFDFSFQVLGHPISVGYGLHLVEWAFSQIRYWLVTPTRFVPPLP